MTEPVDKRAQELAAKIADDDPVDWAEERQQAADDPERQRTLQGLQEVAQISRAHAEWTRTADKQRSPVSGRLPQRWGHLEILEEVGAGGFGRVVRARDPQLDRIVALKLQYRSAVRDESSRETIDEASLLARVKHPNVVTVHGAAEHDGIVGLWMEFIEGSTLGQVLAERGQLSAMEATVIGVDLCGALAALHRERIVHRDVKAGNVMRENRGRNVLMDLGIGRRLEEETADAQTSGTPYYMAPEVLRGKPADTQSDLYSLGVLLYHTVSGEFPFAAVSLEELQARHDTGAARRLRDLRPDLDSEFVAVVEKSIASDPSKRFATAGEMESALRELLHQDGSPKRPWRIWVGAAALVGAVVTGILFLPKPDAATLVAQSLEARARGDAKLWESKLLEAVRRDPTCAPAHAHLASLMLGKNKYLEAGHHAARAEFHCCAGIGDDEAHFVRGVVSTTRMQLVNALTEYRQATRLDPENYEYWFKLGGIQAALGRNAEAVESFRQALVYREDHLYSRGFRVLALGMLGEYDEAMEELETGRRIANPEQADYFFWGEGIAEWVAGHRDAAGTAFRSLRDSTNQDLAGFGRLYLASLAIYEGRLHDAAHALDSDLHLENQENKTSAAARRLNQLAWIHLAQGDRAKATSQLGIIEAVPSHPAFVLPFRDAALLYVNAGDLDGARRLLDRLRDFAAQATDDFIEACIAQVAGEIAAAEGDRQEAARSLEQATRLHLDPSTIFSRARQLQIDGDHEAALRHFQDVIDRKGQTLQWHSPSLWLESLFRGAECQTAIARRLQAEGRAEEAAQTREAAKQLLLRRIELWEHGDSNSSLRSRAEQALAELQQG